MIEALRDFVGVNDMMAYLVMMCVRLIELRRVLKDTGSLYLHCDSTASHYLKIVLDTIFGKENFRNEIIWKRTFAHNDPRRFGRNTDRILFYSESREYRFQPVITPYDQKYVEEFFRYEDERGVYRLVVLTGPGTSKGESGTEWRGYNPTKSGRSWSVPKRIANQLVGEDRAINMSILSRLDLLDKHGYIVWSKNGIPRFKQYLKDMKGAPAQELWSDIPPIGSQSKERLGYPTQKPLALLERILLASSKEGDIILDPFCGCGTAVIASQKLNRRWIGIDITHLAVNLMKYRLSESFPELKEDQDYEIIGVPKDVEGAVELFQKDPCQFEWWALSLISAKPSQNKKKGANGGVDGVIYFEDYDSKKKQFISRKAIVQVKGGKVGLEQMKAFTETMRLESAELGIFLTLNGATYPMEEHARKLGQYESMSYAFSCPRMQIYRIQSLLEERIQIQLPPYRRDFHKRAQTQKDAPNLLF